MLDLQVYRRNSLKIAATRCLKAGLTLGPGHVNYKIFNSLVDGSISPFLAQQLVIHVMHLDGVAVACSVVFPIKPTSDDHKARLVSVYVAPNVRSIGLGNALVRAIKKLDFPTNTRLFCTPVDARGASFFKANGIFPQET